MPTFREISNNLRKINLVLLFQSFFLIDGINDAIVRFITTRLFQEGTTGDNVELETDRSRLYPYSDFTVNEKSIKGQPIDRVTLKDTGKFYDSIFVKVERNGFIVGGDFLKETNHIFVNFQNLYPNQSEFEKSVLSLSENEFEQLLKNYIITELPKLINEKL